jgi:hypothetical protein
MRLCHKGTKQKINEISYDQAAEHVNKAGKVDGGLLGVTETDTARDRWGLTFNKKAQQTRDAKTMYKVADNQNDNDNEHECAHKDSGPKRMKEDQEYVRKFINLFNVYNPFDRTSPVQVSITTGNITSKIAMNDLLHAETTRK